MSCNGKRERKNENFKEEAIMQAIMHGITTFLNFSRKWCQEWTNFE